MVCMGLAYSITEVNGEAMISLIVPAANQGTAFGLIGCTISLALLLEPWAIGYLHDQAGSFEGSVLVFVAISASGALFSLAVFLWDASAQ